MNFLEETREAINKSGHNFSNIVHIGTEDWKYSCGWMSFASMANEEYYPGSQLPRVNLDLVIIFSDGSKLRRDHDEDGERWIYVDPLENNGKNQQLKSVFTGEN